MIAIDCAMVRGGAASAITSTGTWRSGLSARKLTVCCSPPSVSRFTTRRSNGMPLKCSAMRTRHAELERQ